MRELIVGRAPRVVVSAAALSALCLGTIAAPAHPSRERTSPRSASANAGWPPTYIGLDSDQGPGRLVEVETATGHIVRQLVPALPGGGVSFPSTHPGLGFVVYEQGLGTCAAEIDRVDLTSLARRRAVTQPADVADSNPSLSPNGRLVAFVRTRCAATSAGDVSALEIARTGGHVVSSGPRGYYPASPQAWGPNGRSLLALVIPTRSGTSRAAGAALHLLTLTGRGQIVGNRSMNPANGCQFGSALFSAPAAIVASASCGGRTELVELNAKTGRRARTLVTARSGAALTLGPLDARSGTLVYGKSSGPSGATHWYLLRQGRSTILTVPARVTPAAF